MLSRDGASRQSLCMRKKQLRRLLRRRRLVRFENGGEEVNEVCRDVSEAEAYDGKGYDEPVVVAQR